MSACAANLVDRHLKRAAAQSVPNCVRWQMTTDWRRAGARFAAPSPPIPAGSEKQPSCFSAVIEFRRPVKCPAMPLGGHRARSRPTSPPFAAVVLQALVPVWGRPLCRSNLLKLPDASSAMFPLPPGSLSCSVGTPLRLAACRPAGAATGLVASNCPDGASTERHPQTARLKRFRGFSPASCASSKTT